MDRENEQELRQLHNTAIEIGCYNILYEKFNNSLIDDSEYDQLNSAYFRDADILGVPPDECLVEDSGMMNKGNLLTILSLRSEEQLIEMALMSRARRKGYCTRKTWNVILEMRGLPPCYEIEDDGI